MKRYTLFSAFLGACFALSSQDNTIVNTNQSLLSLNPSFAGSNGGIRNQFTYRNQWPNISGTQVSYYNNLDFYLKSIKAGIGISADANDQLNGSFVYRGLGLTYAQHISFSDNSIKVVPSLQAFYRTSEYDPGSLHFHVLQPNWPIKQTRQSYWDFNTGVLVSVNESFFAGASLFHITEPVALTGFEFRQSRKFNLHASYYLVSNEKHVLQLNTRFTTQSQLSSLDISANMVLWRHLVTGIGYSAGEEDVSAALGYRARCFSVVYNYDMTVSKLAGNTAGSHELHLSFNLRNKENRDVLTAFERF